MFAPELAADDVANDRDDALGGGGDKFEVGLTVVLSLELVGTSRAETSGVFDRLRAVAIAGALLAVAVGTAAAGAAA